MQTRTLPVYEVEVGWCTSRPPRDEHLSTLLVEAASETEAHLVAAQWTLANPSCVQPTSTRTVGVGCALHRTCEE